MDIKHLQQGISTLGATGKNKFFAGEVGGCPVYCSTLGRLIASLASSTTPLLPGCDNQ